MKTVTLPDDLADALMAAIGNTSATNPTDVTDYTEIWEPPRSIRVGDVNVLARAAINPLWRATEMAWVLGHNANTSVAEPSNGDPARGQAIRSPAGFPLFWGGDVPYVLYRDVVYPDDASLLDAIDKKTRTPAQQAADKAAWDASVAKYKDRAQGGVV